MEKGFVLSLVFLLLIGFVSGEGAWGEYADGGSAEDAAVLVNTSAGDTGSTDSGDADPEANIDSDTSTGGATSNSEKSTVYTQNFWLALGAGVVALLLFLILLFFLLRRPTNRWKKK
ncbi:MAG: hypothetical protein KKF50_04460 [Nanoarchaeota archaeon]|nr:hypothetical protein [Nanoarchaeota archaeon]